MIYMIYMHCFLVDLGSSGTHWKWGIVNEQGFNGVSRMKMITDDTHKQTNNNIMHNHTFDEVTRTLHIHTYTHWDCIFVRVYISIYVFKFNQFNQTNLYMTRWGKKSWSNIWSFIYSISPFSLNLKCMCSSRLIICLYA